MSYRHEGLQACLKACDCEFNAIDLSGATVIMQAGWLGLL
jgi:hypothetical protein